MKINEFFQKGYYINLDRRTDRREQFEAEMLRVGLEGFFERVPGIEAPADIEPMDKHKYYGDAHHSVLRRAKEAGHDRIVLFEDDMFFYDGNELSGLELVERSLDQLQKFPDWDVIYFGGHPIDAEVPLVDENLCKVDRLLTTHAMGYSRTGLDITLTYKPYEDGAIDGWLQSRPNIQKYMTYPLACPQTQGISDLDAFGSSPGLPHFLETYYRAKYIKQY